ncbi:MAG TPA: DNA-3-methyladenine glycosylase [Gemmatimonadaceae bacterium]|nr:DNA-3-methyladenine glycosylase [Gemmatimonadaceae bacterium]
MTRSAAPPARRSGTRAPSPGTPLPRSYYDRDTAIVSRELLGAVLECRTPEGVASGRIVETEAYMGPHDPACHAVAGLTERTKYLFGPPGVAYVYFIYGMYWCFNAVTREEGHGSAVLVRAIEPLEGEDLMHRRRPAAKKRTDLTNGPGKLCLALGIVGAHNGGWLDESPLRILAGEPVPDSDVVVTPRIGITRAADWPLRYFIDGNHFVSKTPPAFTRAAYSQR